LIWWCEFEANKKMKKRILLGRCLFFEDVDAGADEGVSSSVWFCAGM
jgi:hypothetical protein